MRREILAAYTGAAVCIAVTLYSLSMHEGPQCPDPSPRSVEALFAPCLARASVPAGAPDFLPILPDPATPAPKSPKQDEPAVARSGQDVDATGSIPSK